MDIKNLNTFAEGEVFETDLLIVGGGAAGLAVAREFLNTSWRVMVAESGNESESDEHERLNKVELESNSLSTNWNAMRDEFHGHQVPKWREEVQTFGVRCRGLGGSTQAWKGKSAPFVEHDYDHRPWLENSGWPITKADVDPYVRRGEQMLNLGKGAYGDLFWDHYKGKFDKPGFDQEKLGSFFWQFARSRSNPVDIIRLGPDFAKEKADNVRILLNATATSIAPQKAADQNGVIATFQSIEGQTAKVKARKVVIACGAIENARLLLDSTETTPAGLGNENDQVGRYISDHLHSAVAQFSEEHTKAISQRFGFFTISPDQRPVMYMHGVALGAGVQEAEGLLNAGAVCSSKTASDDPWGAVATLLRGQSKNIFKDLFSIIKGPRYMFTGAGLIFLQSNKVPNAIKNPIINTAVKLMPNFVAEEYQSEGIPRKVLSCGFSSMVEQGPYASNRVTLSENRNVIGRPLPKVKWEIGEKEVHTLMRMGEIIAEQFEHAGLPVPTPVDWIKDKSPKDATIIDMAHTTGSTRMSSDPKTGVVDKNCKLHTCDDVYMAGGSVMPTGSHTNPTLMLVALGIRLADHLKAEFKAPKSISIS